MPLVDIEVRRLLALGMQAAAVAAGDNGIDAQCRLIRHVKTEGGDIHGYSHTSVVRIYLGQDVLLRSIADGLSTGCQTHQPQQYI